MGYWVLAGQGWCWAARPGADGRIRQGRRGGLGWGCGPIEVNSSSHRYPAHQFSENLGFTDGREDSRRFVLPLRTGQTV